MAVHDIKFKRRKEDAFVREIGDMKAEVHELMLSPALWEAFPECGPLTWLDVQTAETHPCAEQ